MLVPAIVIGGVFVAVTGAEPLKGLCDQWKYGYWFTLTLFEFIIVQIVVDSIASRMRVDTDDKAYAALLAVTALLLYGLSVETISARAGVLSGVIGLPLLKYFTCFATGRMARIHLSRLQTWRHNDAAVTIVVVVFIVLGLNAWAGIKVGDISGPLFHLRYIALIISSSLSVFFLFYRHRAWFDSDSHAARAMTFVGRRTLEIYLLHYFFLPKDLHVVGRYFSEHSAAVVEMIVSVAITIVITSLCLLVGEMIRSSSFLHHWMLGGK